MMLKRWMPSPALSLALFVVWILLNQSVHPATLLLAALLSAIRARHCRLAPS